MRTLERVKKEEVDLREMFESNIQKVELTPNQKNLKNKIYQNTITLVSGAAGTSKTFTTCYTAMNILKNHFDIDKIVISKPIRESGENIGFLKGTLEEKIEPYMKSYKDIFTKLTTESYVEGLIHYDKISFEPLAYMRGNTYDNALMILDEAQNAYINQIMLFITRIGKNSKAVILGDISQYDIKEKYASFKTFWKMVQEVPHVTTHKFTRKDIVRNPIIVEITDRYEKMKANGELPGFK